MKYSFGQLINDLSPWLSIGILLGALINIIVPDSYFSSLTPEMARVMILLIGIPLYICASASTPIAASLILKGLSPGSALLFLLVGPATNISNIAVIQKYIGKRGVILNIISIVFVGLVLSYLVDWLYSSYLHTSIIETIKGKHIMNHDSDHNWFEVLCSIFLIVLLVKGIYFEKVRPMISGKGHSH